MKFIRRPAKCIMKWKLLSAFLGACLAPAAWATIPLYDNQDVLDYTIPGTPPPQIDATAFLNENTFTINYGVFNPGTPFYETLNTLFYTNTASIIANSTFSTALSLNLVGLGFQNFGCGYNFDLNHNGNHLWADTFYNENTIHAVSILDGNSLIYEETLFGSQVAQLYQLTSYGQIMVSATNLINPGIVDVSVGGLIDFTGRKVDLTGGQLIVE